MAKRRQKSKSAESAKSAKVVARPSYRGRRFTLYACFALAGCALVAKAVERQVFERDFLQREGKLRYLEEVAISAERGVITDRFGHQLAISSPVESLGIQPRVLGQDRTRLAPLAKAIGWRIDDLRELVARNAHRHFAFVKRHLTPDSARKVRAVIEQYGLKGVRLEREFRRFYPDGEVFAHVLGFTSHDDVGQEGLEFAFEKSLRGEPGAKRVLRDGSQRAVRDIERIRISRPGANLALSIDRRLQFLAYRELKAAVTRHNANSGSVVMLDPKTGDILALVSQPSYNPNRPRNSLGGKVRNRGLIDVVEPGSTMKPLMLAAALHYHTVTPDTLIDVGNGLLRVGTQTVRDKHLRGRIDLRTLLRRSSNIGAAKLALGLDKGDIYSFLSGLGLGSDTGTGFPGERAGVLTYHSTWSDFQQATMAFGYGLSVTPVQLARAYAAIANDGLLPSVTLVKRDDVPAPRRVMDRDTARTVRHLMEAVVEAGGTGQRARVPRYRVAGKTGTTKKIGASGYEKGRHIVLFAGMAPASDPRLVTVVVIDEPRSGGNSGGAVAAPVFSRIMVDALRLLNVPPDDLKGPAQQLALHGGAR